MPLSLAYVASVLREDGHEVQLVDAVADRLDADGLSALCEGFAPDLIILNTAYPSIDGDRDTAATLKNGRPSRPIVILGIFPTLLENKALDYVTAADYAVVGEPEWVCRHLVSVLSKRGDLKEVKGLVWRQGNSILVNPPQDLRENHLDALPFPARDLLHNEAYRLPINGQLFTLLNTGRGCPHACTYCISPAYYGVCFRKRNVKSVGDEIQECIEKHGVRHFLFWGESFTTDNRYGEALCEEIINRNLHIVWSTTTRVDTLNPELLARMKRAGCALLGLGIESSCQEILDRAKKNIRLEQITGAIKMVHAAGIQSMGHFIFGLPGETRETAEETIRFALRSGLHYAQFYCALPYPKTELGQQADASGWIQSDDYSAYDFTFSIMRNESLSSREIKAIRNKAYRRFYFRPRMLSQALREIQSWRNLFASLDFLKWIRR